MCTLLWVISRNHVHFREIEDRILIFIDCQYKMAARHSRRESLKTHEMLTSPTFSTLKHSCAPAKSPKICKFLPLPSIAPPIPTLILPPASSDAKHPHRKFNIVRLENFPTSSLTTSPKIGQLLPSTRSSSLLSPPNDVPVIHHSGHMLHQNKNGTSVCNSHQKLYFTPETSLTRLSSLFIHHQLQVSSSTQNITLLELPASVFDAGCLMWSSHTPLTQDTALSSPSTSAHAKHVPNLIPPSLLQSSLDDVPALCLPSPLSEE